MARSFVDAAEELNTNGAVKARTFAEGSDFVLVVQPADSELDLLQWAADKRELLQELVWKHAGILFRGFKGVQTPEDFQRFIESTATGELFNYTYGSTPRYAVKDKIYTTTIYPPDRVIPFHNEVSYARTWPLRLWLCCDIPPATGGETPVADSRKVLQHIDPRVREMFDEKGVMYIRNFGELIDVPWQKAFVTESKADVEAQCHENRIDFEWTDGDGLRTWQTCQAVAVHPHTRERVWFNQAHLFHVTNIPEARRKRILAALKEEDLPRNAYFGDGSPIDDWMLDDIRDAFAEEKAMFPWQKGDVVMVDNMLAAHAREPFSGDRMIWIGMAEAYTPES